MVELFTSTGKGFDSTIKFNASMGEDASTGEEYCESTGKYNSIVELFTSTGRDIESTISTGELNGRRILWINGQIELNGRIIYLNGQRYWVSDLNVRTQRAKNIVNQRANIT